MTPLSEGKRKKIHAAAGNPHSIDSGEDQSFIVCDSSGDRYGDPESSYDWDKVTCKFCLAAMRQQKKGRKP